MRLAPRCVAPRRPLGAVSGRPSTGSVNAARKPPSAVRVGGEQPKRRQQRPADGAAGVERVARAVVRQARLRRRPRRPPSSDSCLDRVQGRSRALGPAELAPAAWCALPPTAPAARTIPAQGGGAAANDDPEDEEELVDEQLDEMEARTLRRHPGARLTAPRWFLTPPRGRAAGVAEPGEVQPRAEPEPRPPRAEPRAGRPRCAPRHTRSEGQGSTVRGRPTVLP